MFKIMIMLSGLVQLAIAVSTLAIPKLLDWPRELRRLEPLTRSIFWTYAGYILSLNLWFGAMALGWSGELLGGTPLAALVTGFIALYWLVRVVGQFTWYAREIAHTRRLFQVAEVLYVTGFVFLACVFSAAAAHNVTAVLR